MSLHISKQEAAEKALQLAVDFMRQQETNGYDWKCGATAPDVNDPHCLGRNFPTRWTVLIEYSKNGAPMDGPGILKIDIVEQRVEFDVSP